MRAAVIGFATVMSAALLGGPAMAGEVSATQSSSSFTISLVIPPVSAALEASRNGAAGLWTIDGSANENMVQLPAELTGTDSEAQVFHSPQTVLNISLAPNPYVQLGAASSTALNGLMRNSLHLVRSTALTDGNAGSVVTMFVSTI